MGNFQQLDNLKLEEAYKSQRGRYDHQMVVGDITGIGFSGKIEGISGVRIIGQISSQEGVKVIGYD